MQVEQQVKHLELQNKDVRGQQNLNRGNRQSARNWHRQTQTEILN